MKKLYNMEEDRKEIRRLIWEKEPEANRKIGLIYYFLSVLLFLAWIASITGFIKTDVEKASIFFLCTILISFGVGCVCIANNGKGVWKKYLLVITLLVIVFSVNLFFGTRVMILFVLPILITCRYSNLKLTISTAIISSILVAACVLLSISFAKELNSINLNTVHSNSFTYAGNKSLEEYVLNAGLIKDVTLASATKTVIFPTVAALMIVMIICIVIINYNIRMTLALVEGSRRELKMELDVANSRSKVMLSQIQPHFIYNSLSAIMAIDGNPDETVEALSVFSHYLRENLNSLTENDTITFSQELDHIKKYLSIEKYRFLEDLKVEYDIECTDFMLPTLSAQVLVENAVKHGVMERESGGTVKISSREDADYFIVTISDDGVGFDVSDISKNTESIGINNVRMRLETLCKGTLNIQSEIGKGTIAEMKIPKKE